MAPTASMSESTKTLVRGTFNGRCVLCMGKAPTQNIAYILNSSPHIKIGLDLKLLRAAPERKGTANGLPLCSTCHLAYMTSTSTVSPVAFIPCVQILGYLDWYLDGERNPNQNHRNIEDILEDLHTNSSAEAAETRPFVDLYQLLVQGPLDGEHDIETKHMPPVVYFCNKDLEFLPVDERVGVSKSSTRHPFRKRGPEISDTSLSTL
ncbi:hypothetical protein B0H17DRAFT_11134 [Mycena rosella]|uniref:Uncharacterized protein n=1 Tax=Mycena rosella TaxID=1033263 RepID=A0AAD7GSS0_MYCRO|nr:hypothetical protein B0H17DRAFT_11134 [Mycena rosella]